METQTTVTENASAVAGLIAAAGPTGLRLLTSDGTVINEMFVDQVVTQPTWSRDGSRLAVTLTDPTTGAYQIAVVDMGTMEVTTEATRRHYFFYSWSHDGSRLAALGPGSTGTTALDILDDSGTPSSSDYLESASLYLAWEPGGRRLLLHAGPQMFLINDPDTPEDHIDLGLVGSEFQAPAWVPGTNDFLYIDSDGQAYGGASQPEPSEPGPAAGPRLLRRNAETGEITDLGPVSGFTMVAAHPDGESAALATFPPQPPSLPDPASTLDTAALAMTADLSGSEPDVHGAVEIVDLATGTRRLVLDREGFWLEWSPDGRRLLVAVQNPSQSGQLFSWLVWDGEDLQELTSFTPTAVFLQNYVAFADQYTETPRLWSPDGAAIAFGALIDGGAATAVALMEDMGRSTSLGAGDVAFWSPDLDGNYSPES